MSKAFTCLSDAEKRRHYDVTGAEPGANGRVNGMNPFGGGGAAGMRGFNPMHQDNFDADEIFRMFFGGNPFMAPAAHTVYQAFQGNHAAARQRQRQQQQQQQHQQQQAQANGGGGGAAAASPEATFIKILTSLAPLLLIILLQLFSHSSRPAFSLNQTRHYPAPMSTTTHQIPFFVKSAAEFSAKYPLGSRERTRVELTAESEWREAMQQECYKERVLKRRYEYYGQMTKAAQVKLTSCIHLTNKFSGGGGGGTAAAAG